MSNPTLTVELAREALKHGGVVYCKDGLREDAVVMLKDEVTHWVPERGNALAFLFKSYQAPFTLVVEAEHLDRFAYCENVNYTGPR